MLRNIYKSIKNNFKDSLILLIIIFILLNFMFIVINASGLNNYIINHVKDSIEIRKVFNLNTKIDNENKYNYYKYFEEIINNLSKFKDKNIVVDFSLNTNEILHDNNLNIGFNAISILNENSLSYYNYNLIEGAYIKDSDSSGDINILINQRIAEMFNYQIGSELELEIKDTLYTFNIVGIYENNKVSSLIYNPSIISFADIIMSCEDMLNIIKDTESLTDFTNVAFRYYGSDNIDKYDKYIIQSFKQVLAKYYSELDFEYELTSNIDTIDQLLLPLNNAAIVFGFMSIILIIIAFIILSSTISYIIKNRLKDLSIYIALGQSKSKTIITLIIELMIITTISIILTIPTSNISYHKLKDIFIDLNMQRQEDIALISTDSKEYNEFTNDIALYQDLDNSYINISSFIIVDLTLYVIVIISTIIGLKEIIYLKPKELIYKRG